MDLSRLSPSSVSVPLESRSMGNARKAPGVVMSSPSEESEAEANAVMRRKGHACGLGTS
jgi:hypothetical protein